MTPTSDRTLYELIESMARSSLAAHYSDRRTRAGTPMKSASFNVDHVLVTLPEELMLAVARNPESIPRKIGDVPIRISEAPARVNKPSGLPMLGTMCKYVGDDQKVHGSIGNVTLWDGRPSPV